MRITREVALTETWLDHQAQLMEGSFPRVSGKVWASEIGKALVWLVGLVLLLFGMAILAPESRADSVNVASVAAELDAGTVLPLAGGVDRQLASNLIQAQTQAWGKQWFEGSLELSIESVLRAITFYVWPGGPAEITRYDAPGVWIQSHIAIDPRLTVSFGPAAIDFGEQPVVATPEPDVALLLLLALVLALPIPSLIRSGFRRSVATVIVARLRAYRAVRP